MILSTSLYLWSILDNSCFITFPREINDFEDASMFFAEQSVVLREGEKHSLGV